MGGRGLAGQTGVVAGGALHGARHVVETSLAGAVGAGGVGPVFGDVAGQTSSTCRAGQATVLAQGAHGHRVVVVANIAGTALTAQGSEIAGQTRSTSTKRGTGIALDIAGKTYLVATGIIVPHRTDTQRCGGGGNPGHG